MLKPCPFCGVTEYVRVNIDTELQTKTHYNVICDAVEGGCGAQSGYKNAFSEEAAIERWNKRAHED